MKNVTKSMILSAVLITSSMAFATPTETTDLMVEGVHCAGCTKSISKKVCGDTKISENFESCGVTVVDEEKQIGKISLRLKDGKQLDEESIGTAVQSAGKKYKLIKREPNQKLKKYN